MDGLDGFMTSGYGGQNVMVFPEVELVLVTSSLARVGAATADAQQRANWALSAEVVRALGFGPAGGG